jgi:hypothetical protein
MLAELLILLQPISQPPHIRTMDEARQHFDRLNTDREARQAAEVRHRNAVAYILKERHLDFIHSFNLYLDGYRRGSVNVANLRAAVKAFKKLESTEGFKEYVNSSPKRD